MQNLRVLAGARGRTWRVERVETFDRRTGLAIAHLTPAGGSHAGTLIAVRPFEPVSRIAGFDELRPMPADAALAVVDEAMRGRRTAFTLGAAERLRGDIHAWQLAAALAFERGHARVLVADEAGMGKTISAGLAIAQCLDGAPDRRCLVLAPGHLLRQWQTELEDRLGLDPRILDAAAVVRLQREIPAGVPAWWLPGCFITSIDFIKQPHVLMPLTSTLWDLLVIDEAHAACGDSERREAADLVARRSRGVLLLTATPSDGGGDRLRALVALGAASDTLIHLRHSPTGREHVERHLAVAPCAATQALHEALEAYTHWIACGPRRGPAAVALLCSLLAKRALSSAHALALSLKRRLALIGRDPQPTQASLFEPDDDPDVLGAGTGRPIDRERRRLERLLSLAEQSARDDRKLRLLLRLVAKAREPMVIFTCFRDTALLLANRLSPHAPVRLVHGQMPQATIDAALRAFTEGPAHVLVATDVASQGLNLHQRCRWVLHYDLPWRPPAIRQRIGRVDRLGQTRRAHATFLVERTALAAGAMNRIARLTARMHTEEAGGSARWDVLAAAEAARLRALRATHAQAPSAVVAPLPRAMTVAETEYADGGGMTIERAVSPIAAGCLDARAYLARAAARRRAQLSRRLSIRTARRIARERAVLAAALAAASPSLRQDGLFDRRADRQRQHDAGTRARLEQHAREAIGRHVREGTVAAVRCRTIATFVAGRVRDAR